MGNKNLVDLFSFFWSQGPNSELDNWVSPCKMEEFGTLQQMVHIEDLSSDRVDTIDWPVFDIAYHILFNTKSLESVDIEREQARDQRSLAALVVPLPSSSPQKKKTPQ